MTPKKVMLVAVIVPLLWAGFEVSQARNARMAILSASDASAITNCRGTQMTNSDCYLTVLAKTSTSSIEYFLLNLDLNSLWCSIYVIAGISGGVFSYWLMALQGASSRDFDWNRIFFRTLLGGGAGFICYLLAKLPSPLFTTSFALPRNVPGIGNARGYALYESLEFLPVLAGLFLGTFFESLREILVAQMNRFKATTSAGGEK